MNKMNNAMNRINLNNCILTFRLADEVESDHILSYEDYEDEETDEIIDDIDDCEHSRVSVYTNSIRNVSIICEQFRFDDEEWFDDTSEIINLINEEEFNELVRYINAHDNITIYISQVFGTTSDFTIYTNTYIKSFKDFQDFTDNIRISTNLSYKYLIVNGNKIEKFV